MLNVRPVCVPEVVRSRVASPERHRSASSARRQRVLTIAGWIAAVVSAAFGVFQLTLGGGLWWLGVVNIICGAAFLTIPDRKSVV